MAKKSHSPPTHISALSEKILRGDRRSLAKGITLIESSRPDQRQDADALLALLLPHTGKATRIGLSGAPGVGKSTFIEAFGMFLIERGKKIAVLAIDPSSSRSGGSILGDKTRMEELSREKNAFIRPSPAGETLGGVARRTREALLLVEAAGFDVVVVETVGVGQSETAVADMVDLFTLLLSPAGGDELQGIKRGIMELADLIVVNKADGDMKTAANLAAADYRSALHLMRPKIEDWQVPVLMSSAVERHGFEDIWETVQAFITHLRTTDQLTPLRRRQAKTWMWSEISGGLTENMKSDQQVMSLAADLEQDVGDGLLTPGAAADRILTEFFNRRSL